MTVTATASPEAQTAPPGLPLPTGSMPGADQTLEN
ncbi:hypothetical protein J2X98_001395 [Pseudarthrobacter enclensis]|uniref:Uncharacterized protein n=1 Tax=Pseudarthrobacter enclensis TaxID=993070 RepID=A0ABT9RRY6_9MICC|nr:hypothetical protein [Pseudarthrobacter enclensis]